MSPISSGTVPGVLAGGGGGGGYVTRGLTLADRLRQAASNGQASNVRDLLNSGASALDRDQVCVYDVIERVIVANI